MATEKRSRRACRVYRVVLTGKATRNRLPLFQFCFGECSTRREADRLAAKVRTAHPRGVVRVSEMRVEKSS